jgi:hypothetical protein
MLKQHETERSLQASGRHDVEQLATIKEQGSRALNYHQYEQTKAQSGISTRLLSIKDMSSNDTRGAVTTGKSANHSTVAGAHKSWNITEVKLPNKRRPQAPFTRFSKPSARGTKSTNTEIPSSASRELTR